MKKDDKLEEMLIKRLDGIESKLDNIFENVVPQLRTDIALVKKDSTYFSAIATAVGGAVATVLSITVAKWSK